MQGERGYRELTGIQGHTTVAAAFPTHGVKVIIQKHGVCERGGDHYIMSSISRLVAGCKFTLPSRDIVIFKFMRPHITVMVYPILPRSAGERCQSHFRRVLASFPTDERYQPNDGWAQGGRLIRIVTKVICTPTSRQSLSGEEKSAQYKLAWDFHLGSTLFMCTGTYLFIAHIYGPRKTRFPRVTTAENPRSTIHDFDI
ncbi:hypothetical protein IW262DRAFT_1293740 [Armillaria fumosa]|nr:hypothetical protein IW262DRAFT_1293740 [Armillaria fumosa]